MVAEADESDRSFLKLSPAIAVITNVDHEHMEAYGTWDALQQAFVDFANKVPFYGAVIACADDEPVRAMIPRITRRVMTYGLADGAVHPGVTVTGHDVTLEAFGSRSTVRYRAVGQEDETLGELRLRVPGRHNLLNALGATTVGLEVGLRFDQIAAGLAEFRGAERRFQLRGEAGGVMVVDDYGHHPTEISAVIAATRAINRRLIVVFQPHRYSRTAQLMREFGTALSGADEVVLTDIYPAGEAPIPGVTIDALAASVREVARGPVHLVASIEELPGAVASLAREGDLIVTMGAGSIGTVGDRILAAIGQESAKGIRR
jgi:UDP-N-acetylmuramate--alanine ligase